VKQAVEREIGERIGLDVLANLFDGLVGGDQVALARRIDAVEAGRNGRRTTDAQVHFLGPAPRTMRTILRDVVPRMIESSMSITRLPSSRLRTGLSLSLTPKSRTRCSGSINVRPT
jgi:hypothetical protein